MSAPEIRAPEFVVRCDEPGCAAEFRTVSAFSSRFARGVRNEAAKAGWDVPPPRGTGSRRGTDFCPTHAGGAR